VKMIKMTIEEPRFRPLGKISWAQKCEKQARRYHSRPASVVDE
jgi:hypothetical protein